MAAHEEVAGVRPVIDAVEPPLPGVTIQVRISAADQLVVANPTPNELAVIGELDEPFLRIGPDGVFANVRSPTWYRSNDPTGSLPVPPTADADASPRWGRISREPSWGWFDHRMHRVQLRVPPDTDGPVTLERWTIPMRYGDRDVQVRGRRVFRPVRGGFRAEITRQMQGLEASILPGTIPGVLLRVSTDEPVTIFDADDVPMAQVLPSGLRVNEASSTWSLTTSARTGRPPEGDVGPGVKPRWREQGKVRQLVWLEPRATFGAEEPPGDLTRERVVKRWSIPLKVAGARRSIEGTITWLPTHAARRVPWLPVVIGGVLVAGAAGVLVARRR